MDLHLRDKDLFEQYLICMLFIYLFIYLFVHLIVCIYCIYLFICLIKLVKFKLLGCFSLYLCCLVTLAHNNKYKLFVKETKNYKLLDKLGFVRERNSLQIFNQIIHYAYWTIFALEVLCVCTGAFKLSLKVLLCIQFMPLSWLYIVKTKQRFIITNRPLARYGSAPPRGNFADHEFHIA